MGVGVLAEVLFIDPHFGPFVLMLQLLEVGSHCKNWALSLVLLGSEHLDFFLRKIRNKRYIYLNLFEVLLFIDD